MRPPSLVLKLGDFTGLASQSIGRCSDRKFSRAVLTAVSAALADFTAALAALRVDTSVVAKITACIPAINARTKVATAKTASGRHLQNFHHGGEGNAGGLFELVLLGAGGWP